MRRKRLRLAGFNYSESGAYFVTICAKDRARLFGEISNGVMCVNRFGGIVQECWNDLQNHYATIAVDAFVVMPNHVHGIIVIVERDRTVGEGLRPSPTGVERHGLPEIMRAFKSFSARRINEIRCTPGLPVWQRNYFEHIIRNDKSLDQIRQYIATNPQRWKDDKENVDVRSNDEFGMWLASEGRESLRKEKP